MGKVVEFKKPIASGKDSVKSSGKEDPEVVLERISARMRKIGHLLMELKMSLQDEKTKKD